MKEPLPAHLHFCHTQPHIAATSTRLHFRAAGASNFKRVVHTSRLAILASHLPQIRSTSDPVGPCNIWERSSIATRIKKDIPACNSRMQVRAIIPPGHEAQDQRASLMCTSSAASCRNGHEAAFFPCLRKVEPALILRVFEVFD